MLQKNGHSLPPYYSKKGFSWGNNWKKVYYSWMKNTHHSDILDSSSRRSSSPTDLALS
jgi:hypothetical protein